MATTTETTPNVSPENLGQVIHDYYLDGASKVDPTVQADGNYLVTATYGDNSTGPAQPSQDSSTLSIQDARQQLNITVDLIPQGNSNRPGAPLSPVQITIHNTDNPSAGADAKAHADYQQGQDARDRQVSWHFTVDDHSVYQSLPVNEVGWHAGTHDGNYSTIGIEICENQGIDQQAANSRAALLTAVMLHELDIALDGNVVQHNHWSGKDCPYLLRHPDTGWTNFLQQVAAAYAKVSTDAAPENKHGAPIGGNTAPSGGSSPTPAVAVGGSVNTNIYSTEFGGGSEAGMPSAYDGVVDPNQPQAALPARVSSSQRQIHVTNISNGKSVVCYVNDVGPWNKHDAYWTSGSRPAAEAQFQNQQVAENNEVPDNPAGLDLTPAAMLALGVSGPINTRSVTVNWQFV